MKANNQLHRQTNRCKRSGAAGAALQPPTHHVSDPVPSEVEFGQSVEASEVGHTSDLVPSQVEHPEMAEVGQVFNVPDLWGGRGREGGRERDWERTTDGGGLSHHVTMQVKDIQTN